MDIKKVQIYASWAEVVSALAIIISLIYVAYEVQQTSTMSSREADVILFEREREAHRLVISSPGLAEILVVAEASPQDLSPADSLRYLSYQHDFFDSWELGWYYNADGILDDESWAEWDEWFAAEARRRPAFAWTENRQNFTGEGFLSHVDAALMSN